MRILVIGAGGVGSSIAAIAERRDFFESFVLADVSLERAQEVVDDLDDGGRFSAARVDARDVASIVALAHEAGADVIVNACDPRLNATIFEGAFQAGCSYIDMVMDLSRPHPDRPYQLTGVMLGDTQ